MSAITDLPTPPSTSDPANFNTRADAFLGALPQFVAEANAYGLYLAGAATPGGLTIPYAFATSTSGNPGTGGVAVNNATQNLATIIRASQTDGVGTTVTALLASMTLSSSGSKGFLRLTKVGDASKWLVVRVSGVTVQTGYDDIAVVVVAGSSASPFAATDALLLTFTPSGDAGSAALWLPILSNASPAGVSSVAFTSIPTGYGSIEFQLDVTLSGADNIRAEISANNGSTYNTTPVLLTTASTTAYKGVFRINDYRSDAPDWEAIVSNSLGASPDMTSGTGGTTWGNIAATGGVNAVRFTAGGKTITGSIKPRAQ